MHGAARRIELLQREIRNYYWDFRITPALVELRNLATVAELIVMAAKARRESRGLHYTLDYPDKLSREAESVIRREFEG